jgi:SAM-dependent methyltransferase
MALFFAVLLFILAVAYNIKIVCDFIRCGGKEPPFICSLGAVKKTVLEEAERFLEKNKNAKVTDLGCGSGSLLIPLAKKYSLAKFVGYEYDWFAFLIAKIRTFYIPNLVVYKRNFLKEDLSEYDLVLGYWISGLVDKLGNKLNKELREDAVVISEIFEVPVLRSIKVIESSLFLKKLNVYVYHPNK